MTPYQTRRSRVRAEETECPFDGSRRRPMLIAAAMILVASLVIGAPAGVDATDNLLTFTDVHGIDDAGAQSDLWITAVDYSHADTDGILDVRWTWDETNYSGNNTGDACALFDTTGDGLANYAACVSIGGSPATQLVDSPRVYECTSNNLSNRRCNGDTLLPSFLTTCVVTTELGDTVATCAIDLDDVGGDAATLINTCSFNSQEPNSNPVDCVLEPGMGITTVKDVTDDGLVDSDFDVVVDATGTITRTITGDGEFFVPLPPGNHSVAEVGVPPGYVLDSSSCTSGTPSSVVLVLGGTEAVTCTFTNRRTVPSMAVTKTFGASQVAAGTIAHTFTVQVTNDGDQPLTDVEVTDTVDPALTVTNVSADLGGDCSATVGNAVSCTFPSLVVAATATVTVTYAVDQTVEPATVSNTASATSNEIAVAQTGSDSVDVVEDVTLTVSKVFTPSTVAAGTSGNSFAIAVSNVGTSDTENVNITDSVDPLLTVTGVTISPVGDCSASSGQNVDCTVADLGAAQTVTVTVTYDVAESADAALVSNTASAVSNEQVVPVTATDSATVVEDVDLVVVKTFGTDPVFAGSVGNSFTIQVTNAGPSDAENVSIVDVVAAPLVVTAVAIAPSGTCDPPAAAVSCAVASLASGESAAVTVTFDVPESADPTTLTNTASVTSDEVTVPVNSTDTASLEEDVAFGVTKNFTAASVAAGTGGHTFTIEVTNTGQSDAENVTIADTVDPALTVTGISTTAGTCAPPSNSISCSIASMGAGTTATVTVTYSVPEAADPGTVANTAQVTSDEVSTPVTGSGSVELVEDVSLTASKTFSPATVAAGTAGNSFTLVVSNTGSSDADNVSITDVVQAELEVTGVTIAPVGDCSASAGQNIDCTVGSLGGGQSVTVTVDYQVDSAVSPGPITNSVVVVSDEDSTTGSDSVEIVAQVGFEMTKAFTAAIATAGTSGHTFTLAVTNSGPSDASNVNVTDAVPVELAVTGIAAPGADCSASAGQSIDCTVASLPAGSTVVVTVTYDVDASVEAATVTNTAAVSSNEAPVPVTSSDSVDVVEDVTIAATKTFADTSVAAGSVGHTFTIDVSNSGQSDAENIAISDTVDPSLVVTVVAISEPTGDCSASSGQIVSCSLATLGPGSSVAVTVTYDVAVSASPATVSNTASVSSDEDSATASDSVDVIEDVTLLTTKTFADATVAAGTVGNSFTITVTNTGQSDAENIAVSDAVDPRLAVTDVTGSAGVSCDPPSSSIACSLASLGPGATMTVTVTYDVVESADPATLSNTATVSSDEDATTATDTIDLVEDVDLGFSKSFTTATATAGAGGYTFVLSATNSGTSDAENVRITDSVPSLLAVSAVSPLAECAASSGNVVDCTFATVGAGQTVVVTVTYSVPETTDSMTLTNSAAVTSEEIVTPIDGTDDVEIVESAALIAAKSFAAATVTAGTTGHTFAISVTNTGISDGDNVSIIDTVDAALSVTGVAVTAGGDCSASSGQVVDCTMGTLAAGATMTVTVTYDVDQAEVASTVTNTADVTSDETVTPLAPSDTVDVVEDVDLGVVKSFSPGTATAGSTGNVFTVAVTNTGSSRADSIVVTDDVDATITVTGVSIAPAGDCSATGGNAVECSVPSIASGGNITITVTYSIPPEASAGAVFNSASVTSDEVVTPAIGSDTLTVTEDVGFLVDKTFAVSPVAAGSTANTFSVSVANTGLSAADNVVVTDTVDPSLVVTGATVAPAGDCSATAGNAVSCTVASLAPSATATIIVTYDVPEGADPSVVANTASVVSDEVVTPATGTDSVQIVEDIDLAAVKSFAADPVVAGSVGNTFSIQVSNSGLSDTENLTITDTVDAALTVTDVSIAPAGDCSASVGNSVACTVATLAAGGSVTVTVTYDVPESTDAGTVANTASVDADELVAPLTPSASVDVVEDVTLAISKTFATATAVAGNSGYTFSIQVTNSGLSDADNVVIADAVDAALTVTGVAATHSGDCSGTIGNSVTCAIATLPGGETATVTVTYDVDAAVPDQTVSNTAGVVSDEVTVPLTDAATVDVNRVVTFASTKTFANPSIAAGTTGETFTVTVANSGPSDATGIVITDVVGSPLVVTGVSISDPAGDCSATVGNNVSCSLGFLPVGSTVTLTVTFDVPASAGPGSITNTANVTSTVPASSVDVSADLDITEDVTLVPVKSFTADPVPAGSSGQTFTLTVSNTGLSDADNVVVTDAVDPAMTVTGVSSATGDCSATVGNAVSCSTTSLGSGESLTVTVTYDIAESVDPTIVSNTMSAGSDEVIVPVTASDSLEVIEDIDLDVTKTFAPAVVTAGGSGYSFGVSVGNAGLSDAENVRIVDLVDPALTVTGTSLPGGDCSATIGNSIDCTVPSLPSGATATLIVFYDVAASEPAGLVANTASAVSDEITVPVTGNDTVEIVQDVGLVAVKSFTADPVPAGTGGHSFTVTVTSTGLSDADNLVVADAVDPALTVTGAAMPGGDCSATVGNSVSCTLATLAAAQAVTVTVTYDVAESVDSATIPNTATVIADLLTDPVTASSSVEVVEDVSLVVVKTFTADPVAAGTVGNSFTIDVTNLGTSDAENVVVTDTVDPAVTVAGAAISPVGDCSATVGQDVSCTVATLAAGATATVTVTYDVAESVDPASVSNTASVVSDEVTVPVTASSSVEVVEDVSLVVVKTFTADPVAAGTVGNSFTIDVTNLGTSDAENVVVTDTVDPALSVVGAAISPVGDCSATVGQDVHCTIATLAASQVVTIVVTYDVAESVDPASVSNTASVVSDEVTVPVTASASVEVVEDVDLVVVKTFTADPVAAGTVGNSFTIDVTNLGTSDAENVVLTDTVDPALSAVGAAISPVGDCSATVGQDVSCTVASLPAGATVTVTVTYDADPAALGPVANTASVVSDEVTAPVADTTSVDLVADVDLLVVKTFADDEVTAGTTDHAFDLAVTNNGPSDAVDVRVTDMVDPGLVVTAVSLAPGGDCSASSGQDVDCTVSTLAAGSTTTVTVTYDVAPDVVFGVISNTMTASSPSLASPVTASDTIAVVEEADLSVTKISDVSTAMPGSAVEFTIEVLNVGPGVAFGATISDPVAAGLEAVTWTCSTATDPGSSCAPATGTGDVLVGVTLHRGDRATVVVSGVVAATAVDTITNHASVESPTDPETSDNEATSEIVVEPLPNDPPTLETPNQLVAPVGGQPSRVVWEDPDGEAWTITSVTNAPPGLVLNADGTWSGAATQSGTWVMAVRACDPNGNCTTEDIRVTVSALAVTGTTVTAPLLIAVRLIVLGGLLAALAGGRRPDRRWPRTLPRGRRSTLVSGPDGDLGLGRPPADSPIRSGAVL